MILGYSSLVADSTYELSNGRALLNEVHLEVCTYVSNIPHQCVLVFFLIIIQLMLSSITSLVPLLDKSIQEYQDSLNAYNACTPSAVCTLGSIHADSLFQEYLFILKYVCYTCFMSILWLQVFTFLSFALAKARLSMDFLTYLVLWCKIFLELLSTRHVFVRPLHIFNDSMLFHVCS